MRKTGKISEPIDTDWGLTCQSSEQQSGATPHLSKMPHRNGRRPFAGWLAMANQLSLQHIPRQFFPWLGTPFLNHNLSRDGYFQL